MTTRHPRPNAQRAPDLKLGVDFGTVCRRCGARLLDETTVTVFMGRRARNPLSGYEDFRGYTWPLCVPCVDAVWGPLLAATEGIRRGRDDD